MKNIINQKLHTHSTLVLDGAMATELEKKGVETDNELWSAMALIKQPEAVKAVHKEYFEAGADVAITNTYQANLEAFEKAGLSAADSAKMITEAVELAQAARQEFWDELSFKEKQKRLEPIIAGSVGPYGAFLADGSEYTGAYQLTRAEYKAFHRPRMQLLAKAGVDLFAFETQPNFEECQALAELLRDEFPEMTAWLTFSVSDSQTICDATPLYEAVNYFNQFPQIVAIGVNCTKMENIEKSVEITRQVTSKPIVVYPNNGDIYDPKTKTWVANKKAVGFDQLVDAWQEAGAQLIGGCCRTTPQDIQTIAQAVLI